MKMIKDLAYLNADGDIEERIYFISADSNTLYAMSTIDYSIEKVAVLGRKSNLWAVLLYERYIFCCALDDCCVYVFDKEGKKINEFMCSEKTGRMLDAFIYKNSIVFVPWNISNNVYFFNISKYEYEPDNYWMTIHKKIEMTGNAYVWNRFDSVLSYVVEKRDRVIVYDFNESKCFQLYNPTNGMIKDCVFADNMVYMLIEGKRALFIYDMKQDRLSVIDTNEKSEHKKLIAYKNSLFIVCSERVLFFENEKMIQTEIKVDCYTGSSFIKIIPMKNEIVFLPWAKSVLAVLDSNSKEVKSYELELPLHDVIGMKSIITEGELSLSDYLLGIVQ